MQGNAITRRLPLDPAALAALPELRALLAGPAWRGLLRCAASYDAEPIYDLQTILSHPDAGPDDPQCDLHSDTFPPSLKAWLFLTDMLADEGPFIDVPGSHRLTPERLAWERARSMGMATETDRLTRRGSFHVTPADLAAMRLPSPRTFAVPANTLVVADTCGSTPAAQAPAQPGGWRSGPTAPATRSCPGPDGTSGR